jgi:serpin B
LLNGETVNVPMMNQKSQTFPYASGDGWQAVALPYKGGLTDMVIIVPGAGNFTSFESVLTGERYTEIVSAMQPHEVILSMPKFTFETSLGLKDNLVGMGMQDAFDPDWANFSGMDGTHLLYLGDALHKAFIAVDEKGTEAAAATIVMAVPTSLMPQGVELTIDRPFFFFIRDVPRGTILFMGRVLDPR